MYNLDKQDHSWTDKDIAIFLKCLTYLMYKIILKLAYNVKTLMFNDQYHM